MASPEWCIPMPGFAIFQGDLLAEPGFFDAHEAAWVLDWPAEATACPGFQPDLDGGGGRADCWGGVTKLWATA